MRIITVSRQFGCGGREVGERLAEILGWDYYDKEIIERLAEEQGLDEQHVRHILSHHGQILRASFCSKCRGCQSVQSTLRFQQPRRRSYVLSKSM